MNLDLKNFFFANLNDLATVVITAPKSKDDLLRQIYAGLQTATECGLNWDALDEMLQDLSWIKQKDIVLIHENLDSLSKEDKNIYAEILGSAAEYWKGKRKHRIFFIVPESMRNALSSE